MQSDTAEAPLSQADERLWAMLAHLSVVANLVTGILGPVIALIIYLAYRDRSRYVGFQAFQSFLFQLIWWVGAGVIAGIAWTATGILSAFLIGLVCIPFACVITLLPVAALFYGAIGAVQTYQGLDFEYWLVGNLARGMYAR